MKKLIVFFSIFSSVYLSAQSEPVKGAAYAEIRGVSGGWIRIYKNADSRYNRTANAISKLWSPKLYFFDKQGNKISQEEFANAEILDRASQAFNSQIYENTIASIQSRLTALPIVDHVGMVQCIKGPGQQWIELLDKKGLVIASLSRIPEQRSKSFYNFEERLFLGNPIPRTAIEMLKDKVSNPEILNSIKISKHRCFPEISLTGLIFKK